MYDRKRQILFFQCTTAIFADAFPRHKAKYVSDSDSDSSYNYQKKQKNNQRRRKSKKQNKEPFRVRIFLLICHLGINISSELSSCNRVMSLFYNKNIGTSLFHTSVYGLWSEEISLFMTFKVQLANVSRTLFCFRSTKT